jgi:hypothetical protein
MGYEVPQRLRYVDWHGGFCGEKQDSHCIFAIGEISYCIGWAPLIHEYPSLKRQVFLHLLLKSGRDLMCRTELESTLHPALCFWNNGWFSFGPTLRFSTCPPLHGGKTMGCNVTSNYNMRSAQVFVPTYCSSKFKPENVPWRYQQNELLHSS